MQKRWTILKPDPAEVAKLQSDLGIPETVCRVLVNRGIKSYEQAKLYFLPELSHLHDPRLMKDMNKAVDRLSEAIRGKEKILVYGDYDVDGTTSVATMYSFLSGLVPSHRIDYYIPHRYREGYGISRQGVDYAIANGFTLVVALDCGIKSTELISYAGANGTDFIVCDHHLPGSELPPASAILNPKQPGCPYPYKDLCGCGIGIKFMQAIALSLGLPNESFLAYLDLAATAIAADIVPMTGENRVMASLGLKKINENPCEGIKALIRKSGIRSELNISNVVFMIAPRVNAAGRMDDARKAVQLFTAREPGEADKLADMLHSDNDDRREADITITREALQIINSDHSLVTRKSSVVYKEDWHKGVVGIVASRLIEHYYRPTVVLTRSGDLVTGSARSVPGFNLYEAIYSCREHLLAYGGHFAAAGLTLLPENVEKFSQQFEEVVSQSIEERFLTPEILLDDEINFSKITPALYRTLARMEPFGPDNMQPLFMAREVRNTGQSKIVKEKHIKFHLQQGTVKMNGIGFNLAGKFPLLETGLPLDVVFAVEENEFNGNVSLQLKVVDLRISEAPAN